MSNKFNVVEIPVSKIKFFVRRARLEEGFDRLKQSIKESGLHVPIQVREIEDPKFDYELICGEGRVTAFRQLRIPNIPAIVVKTTEHDIVGRFLAENVMRKRIPWLQKAKLMKSEIDAGTSIPAISRKFSVSEAHVKKCLQILGRSGVSDKELESLTVDEAYSLTTLPAKGQEIVLETIREESLPADQIASLVQKAREISDDNPAELSKKALKDSLKRVGEDLSQLRESLKLKRLHWSLGPENLLSLLENKKVRSALDRKGINYSKFLKATAE